MIPLDCRLYDNIQYAVLKGGTNGGLFICSKLSTLDFKTLKNGGFDCPKASFEYDKTQGPANLWVEF